MLSGAIWKHPPKGRVRRNFSMRREDMSFEVITSVFDDDDFAVAYRMKRSTFQKLLALVLPALKRNEEMGRLAKRPTIKSDVRLAVFIRMLAGASANDCAMAFGLSKKSVYSVFHDTRNAIDQAFDLPGIPDSFDGLKKIAENFQMSRTPSNCLPGCIGALDGITIKIKKPRRYQHPASYFCRKGYYAIPVQAMCDSNYRFQCYSAICHGSTHDSVAHTVSALGDYLEERDLMNQFWIAGDEAYVCTSYLITPVPGSQATDVEDSFNFFHSSLRMHIEQSFGMLMRKWAILKDLEYSVEHSIEIIGVAMKLHNFCIDHDGNFSFSMPKSREDHQEISYSESWYEEGRHDYIDMVGRSGAEPCTTKRDQLIQIIKDRDMQRPAPVGVCLSGLSER